VERSGSKRRRWERRAHADDEGGEEVYGEWPRYAIEYKEYTEGGRGWCVKSCARKERTAGGVERVEGAEGVEVQYSSAISATPVRPWRMRGRGGEPGEESQGRRARGGRGRYVSGMWLCKSARRGSRLELPAVHARNARNARRRKPSPVLPEREACRRVNKVAVGGVWEVQTSFVGRTGRFSFRVRGP
jgi:hypothetical protein